MEKKVSLENIVSLAKRRGFIYPGSEIYGGLSGIYDYGPLGVMLKHNIQNMWWSSFVTGWDDMYPMDSAILMNQKVWQASGHATGFNDPMVECGNCHSRLRVDHVEGNKCPVCGKKGTLGKPRQFNMMFRLREFEMMEIEYFVRPDDWEKAFEQWRAGMQTFFAKIGLPAEMIHELEVPEADRAHYSRRTIDFDFDFPFGRKELAGLAYRTDFDLKNHQEKSGINLQYRPKGGGEPFLPHVIEPSFGMERLILALLCSVYTEDEQDGEKRTFLKLSANIAPVKAAVFPLLKNKPELVKKASEVYDILKKELGSVEWDDNGNIGKRYHRQDEIGTPWGGTIYLESFP